MVKRLVGVTLKGRAPEEMVAKKATGSKTNEWKEY